jgi:hypothetical protein
VSRVLILDCEAVQAIASETHPHHRHAVAHLQVVADRKRRSKSIDAVVPTSVRVEADLDRTAPSASFFNSLRIRDTPLDERSANVAASLHAQHQVSVPDAHVGAAIAACAHTDDITVITSDPGDMRLVAGETRIHTVKL